MGFQEIRLETILLIVLIVIKYMNYCTECGNKKEGINHCIYCLDNEINSKTTHGLGKKFLFLVYPKIYKNTWWLRLIRILGWILSILTLVIISWAPWVALIVFIVFFSIIQRLVIYIVYGSLK